MPIIKTVGIISKPNAPAGGDLVPKLIEWLRKRAIEVRMDELTAAYAGVRGISRGCHFPSAGGASGVSSTAIKTQGWP